VNKIISATTTTTTSQVPVSSYHNVPVQEVGYNKEQQYATTGGVPSTGYNTNPYGTTTSTSQTYQQPIANTAGYANYEALNQAIPGVSIFLRPIAAPSALGWMSFFAGTFMLFTYYTDWYGGDDTYWDIAPFIFFFAGLCQLVAGFHGYNARDNFATVWFPLWGSFFLAWAYYEVFLYPTRFSPGPIPPIPRHIENDGLAMWFVILTAVSWACFLPSLARDITTALIVLLAAIGSTLEMAYFSDRNGMRNTVKAGGYFLLLAGIVALFRGWLYLVEEAFYETPMATRFIPKYRTPFQVSDRPPVSVGVNEPGVRKGQ